jgi:hypothetical protein
LSNTEVTLHKAGYVQITATQAGNDNFKPADPVTKDFCVNPQPPELSVSSDETGMLIESNSEVGNLWYKNGILQSDLSGKTISILGAAENNTYTARVIVDRCLSEESNPILVTGVEDTPLRIFPNPVASRLYLNFADNDHVKSIELHESMGRTVFESKGSERVTFIDMDGMSSGFYLLKVNYETSVRIYKVLKK